MEIKHLCYIQPLKNEVPSAEDVLFVFYDFETSQDTKISETEKLHESILVCLQQFCTACDMQDDYQQDCVRCGKRQHSFFEDPVGDLLSYLCEPRPWCKKVVAIAHNAKAFDAQFILTRAILSPSVICRRFVARNSYINGEEAVIPAKLRNRIYYK